jgi:hypothetical protein
MAARQKASFMPLVEKLAGSGLAAGKQTPYAHAWTLQPPEACKNLSTPHLAHPSASLAQGFPGCTHQSGAERMPHHARNVR